MCGYRDTRLCINRVMDCKDLNQVLTVEMGKVYGLEILCRKIYRP